MPPPVTVLLTTLR